MIIKNVTKFLAITLFSTLLASCGSSIKEKTIKANNISVTGKGSDYIKVVDGDYTLKVVEDKIVIAIKLELLKKYDGSDQPEMGNITFIPLDKSGAAVPDIGLDMNPATMSDWDKIKDLLKQDVGKTATISFEWSYFSNGEIQKRIMKETENFEIAGTDFTSSTSSSVISSDSANDETNEEVASVSTDSENWDNVLDNYDKYVDEYIKFFKKAKAGDATAMMEYPALMEKATSFQTSLESAKDDNSLSASQSARMMKIQMKMIKAAQAQ